MILDKNDKIEISNSGASVITIILMAIYFINVFLTDGRLAVAGIYAIILGLTIYYCNKKIDFHELVYHFIVLLILSEIIRNGISYFNSVGLFFNALVTQFKFSRTNYFRNVLATPYIYVYFVGIVLLLISVFAPNLCSSYDTKKVFQILGKHSFWAIVVHMCAVCVSVDMVLEDVIFTVFIISAFWCAYTKEKYRLSSIAKAILLVVELFIFRSLFPKQYSIFMDNIFNIQNMSWYYSVGICVICIICILSDKNIQDAMIGIIILETNILLLLGKINRIDIEPLLILFFHIVALSLYYYIKVKFKFERENKNIYLKLLHIACSGIAFLFVVFVQFQYIEPIVFLCVGLLTSLIYFGDLIKLRGTIYGTIIFGVMPWILLESTLVSLHKLHAPKLLVVLFTILFWCMCSVALSWKDSARIKSIAFDKANSEMIINGLSVMAYIITGVVLFL